MPYLEGPLKERWEANCPKAPFWRGDSKDADGDVSVGVSGFGADHPAATTIGAQTSCREVFAAAKRAKAVPVSVLGVSNRVKAAESGELQHLSPYEGVELYLSAQRVVEDSISSVDRRMDWQLRSPLRFSCCSRGVCEQDDWLI